MPEIQILDDKTIDQIAAGEVVERPSSVVKELVENAVDAGATAITIEIKDGGISLIRITDNGQGIPHHEVAKAFLRHATSKLRHMEDLLTISSLGFRGEALSSIAAVAQVELITKTASEISGTKYQIEGSKEISLEEIGAPEGTTFLVRNLFFNTPARRKFLKSAQTEASYISTLAERLALSHPDISFQLIVNNQPKLHTNGNTKLKDIIYHIFGRDIAAGVLPVHAQCEQFTADGFVGKPFIARGNRNFEIYFINGRYIKSPLITKCIEDAYKSFLMKHQYPFTVLHIRMEPELIDVNVHPAKMEIRFRQSEQIYEQLMKALRGALEQKDLIPQVPPDGESSRKKSAPESTERRPEPFEKKRLEAIAASVRKDSPYERKYAAQPKPHSTEQQLSGQPRQLEGTGQDTKQWLEGTGQDTNQLERTGEDIKQQPETLAEILHPEHGETGSGTFIPQQSSAPAMKADSRPDASASGMSHPQQDSIPPETRNPQMENAESDRYPQPQASDPDAKTSPSGTQEHTKTRYDQPSGSGYEQLTLAESSGYTDFIQEAKRRNYRIIGQLFDTYWLVEVCNELFIIDQHAAHEKVLYEKMMQQFAEHEVISQQISPPVIITMTMQEQELFENFKDDFVNAGFEVNSFGGREYAICAVPANLYSLNQKELFLEMLDGLSRDTGHTTPELILQKIASMSCKAAVKGSQQLSGQEAEHLLSDLLELENPYHCPHGRPTIIAMSKAQIEKKFKRIV